MRHRATLAVLLTLAALWAALMLHRGQVLDRDEVEFFRATRWIAAGSVPYRDFWEHHLPLQWFVFAPAAALFGGGAGAGAVVAIRWAQVPLWVGALAFVMLLARQAGGAVRARWAALCLLVLSPSFLLMVIQYRLDVVGNLAFVAALAVGVRRKWVTFGALMSLAVLANMRLAPLAVLGALLALFWRSEERRWSWNGAALRMLAGVAAVATLFMLYLMASGAWPAFLDGVIHYNVTSDRLFRELDDTRWMTFAAMLVRWDLAAVAYWALAIAGACLALRGIRTPGALQLVALLALASVASAAAFRASYEYHLETAYFLMLPLAALAFERLRSPGWATAILGIAAVSLAFRFQVGEGLPYQDRVMREADARTSAGETVWDGAGYALRRKPAYRYWFLPAGVRLMAKAGLIEDYDVGQLRAAPPAAIIYSYRVFLWLRQTPRLAAFVTHHYVPLYRDLWVPGMSALLEARPSRTTWTVVRGGRYDLYASKLLAKHPWFTRPLEYGMIRGSELAIPLRRLPLAPDAELRWSVDGAALPAGVRTIELRAGSTLELVAAPRARTGVLVVPHGVDVLCITPDADFVF
jgi:hypothetical protein